MVKPKRPGKITRRPITRWIPRDAKANLREARALRTASVIHRQKAAKSEGKERQRLLEKSASARDASKIQIDRAKKEMETHNPHPSARRGKKPTGVRITWHV